MAFLTPQEWREIVRGQRKGMRAFLLRRILWLFSFPYRWGLAWKNRRYDRLCDVSRCSVPVISVGNLSVGGTGKTPFVEYVARLLRGHEIQVAILSRGYGSSSGRNDEAMVLEENLPDVPHLQGQDRVALAATAIEELESEVLLLDDGFQHRRLARNLDIVLVDATEPFLNEYLFPRGTLREPIGNLRRAGAIALTRADQIDPMTASQLKADLQRLAPGIPLSVTRHQAVELQRENDLRSPQELRDRVVYAFCGIGNPQGFYASLEQLGAMITQFQAFADHQAYQRSDIESLEAWARSAPEGAWIVTTQKDWVKIRLDALGGHPLYSLRIGIAFMEGQQEFDQAVLQAALGETSVS